MCCPRARLTRPKAPCCPTPAPACPAPACVTPVAEPVCATTSACGSVAQVVEGSVEYNGVEGPTEYAGEYAGEPEVLEPNEDPMEPMEEEEL